MRSVLLAPGNRPDVLAKMPRSEPDVAIIDWEDAVPAASKAQAREAAGQAVADLGETPALGVLVRVNAVATEFFADDVAALPPGLHGVVVPKLESASQVAEVLAALRSGGCEADIFVGLETARGVEAAVETLAAPGVMGAYFGAEDFVADMGGVRTNGNAEVLYARSRVALAARLAGVPVVDQIVADFGDSERFTREAVEARALGFAGKLCIHPAQVPLSNEAFVPSAQEVQRARALLAAYDAAVTQGHAAIAFEGQMVDEPVARQARSVLARSQD